MKRQPLTRTILGGLIALVMTVTACATTPQPTLTSVAQETPAAQATAPAPNAVIANPGSSTTADQYVPDAAVPAAASGELTQAEIDGIIYMREEEKLARDVYLTLGEQWGIPIFTNIASSEETHMAAVAGLIDQYALRDPAIDKVGVFADATLQALYDQLVATGAQSLADALRVGAAVEEIDILDLEAYLAGTDRADIRSVYENLVKGSRNHLRSFVRTLQRQGGETYEPQYLDQDAFAAIVNAEMERGRGGW